MMFILTDFLIFITSKLIVIKTPNFGKQYKNESLVPNLKT